MARMRIANVQPPSRNVESPTDNVHIFGIRHHGPGSAHSLRCALEELQPDAILIEGPPEAEGVLSLITHRELRPPVALLIYAPDSPRRAVYYPFAMFSPEWQALHFALNRKATIRFIDLPQAHQLALESSTEPKSEIRDDPLDWLARASGYGDGEQWWEHTVEQRGDSRDLFAAILEAMSVLRDSALAEPRALKPRAELESLREAHMRHAIRAAQRERFERIAVVCGAWHAPVLRLGSGKEDAARLKGLAKIQVQATWVPWTYGRLTLASGYGAGITSPGWYHHLWTARTRQFTPRQVAIQWLTRVARLLREQDLDASSAHVIEAVRLAEALAALRERPLPGLDELNEATQTVLCLGSDVPLRLIRDKLIVGENLGAVPDETPMVPLTRDLHGERKRLRLAMEATARLLDLDLRQPTDLARSRLLHRLNLLGIRWGDLERVQGKRGTFHEVWRLQWQPELEIKLIEASVWGNTMYDAATAFARDLAERAQDLPTLTHLLDAVLLANLPEAVSEVMQRVETQAALASDVAHLMDALGPLANVSRYGSVRQMDTTMLSRVIDGLVARICIGLPLACASLNDEAAAAMLERVNNVHSAMALLQIEAHLATWRALLKQLVDQQGLHGLLRGRCCRLLLDGDAFTTTEAERRMSFALSAANEPAHAAAWLEGFLKGSGLLLLHSEPLWQVLDDWVNGLTAEQFTATLPLLRRTFATFTAPERRQMGERMRVDKLQNRRPVINAVDSSESSDSHLDVRRAEQVLPLVAALLGLVEHSEKAR